MGSVGAYYNEIHKKASVQSAVGSVFARNIDDVISMASKQSGKAIPEMRDAYMKSIRDGGTGSMFIDAGLGAAKMIPSPAKKKMYPYITRQAEKSLKAADPDYLPGKPLKKPIENMVSGYKSKLDDFDIRAGNVLGKKGKLFDTYSDITEELPDGGEVVHRIKTKKLSAPFGRAKKFMLPFMASSFIYSQADKGKPQEGGQQ